MKFKVLDSDDLEDIKKELYGWKPRIMGDKRVLAKEFSFMGFSLAIAFLNKVIFPAVERVKNDLILHFSYDGIVLIGTTTKEARNSITNRDVLFARKVEGTYQKLPREFKKTL